MGFLFKAADKVTDTASADRILSKYKNKETTFSLDSDSFKGTFLDSKAEEGNLEVTFMWEEEPAVVEKTLAKLKASVGSMVRFRLGSDEFVGILSGITDLPRGGAVADYISSPFMLTFAFSAQDQNVVSAKKRGGTTHFTGTASKAQKCYCCAQPATKSLIWAEGRAYIPTCDKHEAKAEDQIVRKNEDEVTYVRKIDAHLVQAGANSGIIGIPVPKNIQEQLPFADDLEYAPHITVCFFPNLTEKLFKSIEEIAKEAAEAIGTFDVRIDGSTTFPTPQEDGTYPHVAKVKSQALLDYHDLVVDLIERRHPGTVSLEFAHKNYSPHVTLRYTKDSSYNSLPKALAWRVDHVTLNRGKEQKHEISLRQKKTAQASAYLQAGDISIPLSSVTEPKRGVINVYLQDPSQVQKVDDMEGTRVNLVTDKGSAEIEILEIREMNPDGLQIFFRHLTTTVPVSAAAKLNRVLAAAQSRGLADVSARLARFLDFTEKEDKAEEDEPKDKEALGPGFEGTDPHIVTYVKAPQTQVIVEGPKFPRSLALHERI